MAVTAARNRNSDWLRLALCVVAMAAGLWSVVPALAGSRVELDLTVRPERVEYGQTVSIDCRLAVVRDGERQRANGGLLVVSVYAVRTGTMKATYTDVPDGKTDIFGVSWQTVESGTIKVEAVYRAPGQGLIRKSVMLTVGERPPGLEEPEAVDPVGSGPPDDPPAVVHPPAPPVEESHALPVDDVDGRTRVTIRRLPDDHRAGSGAAEVEDGAADVDEDAAISTGVRLAAKATGRPGQWELSVEVTCPGGRMVGDGEVLVMVDAGRLVPGEGGQALLTAAAGRQKLIWTEPASGGRTRIEASYFGGLAPDGRYSPSSAVINLP